MVKNWPRFLNPTYTKNFLGLDLTQKKSRFEWWEACEESFQLLKDRLTFAPVLTLLEGTDGFVVYCEAFRVGLGCVLMLHGKVIVYAYRQIQPHKKNYQLINLNLQP